MTPSLPMLDLIVGRPVDRANASALIAGFAAFPAGLDRPHRLAQFLGQLLHESGGFRYDQEIWGPTDAQKRYDTRTDLGNTAALDGDGFLYRGRGPIQLTGRANYIAFRTWCEREGLEPPDFVTDPDTVLTDPWEGLSPIWFWVSRDLNRYADDGNAEMITRRINGGINGYDDRLRWLTRSSLALLGRHPDDVRGFQTARGLKVDGIAGPATRTALHGELRALEEPIDPRVAGILATFGARLDAIEARL